MVKNNYVKVNWCKYSTSLLIQVYEKGGMGGLTLVGCACRTGRIIINGTIGDANVTASGTSTVYILTVNGTATVNLAGTASVGINSESSASSLTYHAIAQKGC
jgi:hypothetical protein